MWPRLRSRHRQILVIVILAVLVLLFIKDASVYFAPFLASITSGNVDTLVAENMNQTAVHGNLSNSTSNGHSNNRDSNLVHFQDTHEGLVSDHDPGLPPAKPKCMITSYSTDGIGHQMEGKFSCLAVAIALNMTYVHRPIDRAEHGVNVNLFEGLFGLKNTSQALGGVLVDPTKMEIKLRPPFGSSMDECKWFRTDMDLPVCKLAAKVQTRQPVFSSDNCWDYFYCGLQQPLQGDNPKSNRMIQLWQETIAPTIRQNMKLTPNYVSTRQERQRNPSLRVVIHVRRGDGRRRHKPASFYTTVIEKLETNAHEHPDKPSLQFVIHTGVPSNLIHNEFHFPNTSQPVQIFGTDSNVPLEKAIEDMMDSDIYISSESSLSYVCGLLRYENDPSTTIQPRGGYRVSFATLGWSLIDVPAQRGGVIRSLLRDVSAWVPVPSNYWMDIIDKAWQHKRKQS